MEEFKVNEHIKQTPISLISHSKIEGRIDPYYFKPLFLEIEDKIINGKYPFVKFKDVIKKLVNGFDNRDYVEHGTPYIKVANVRKGEFNFSGLKYIDLDPKTIKKKIQLKKGNLLLTRKGSFGYALSLDDNYDYIISSEVFYIELKKSIIKSKYLEIFLNSNTGQQIFDREKIGAIMGSLSQDAIKSLKIPIPPLDIQQQIVDLYQAAYKEKQQKEKEAKDLLSSIDTYLLNELEITLPTKDNSLKSRIFTSKFSEITSNRFDPDYYSSKYAIIDTVLEKYEHIKLNALCKQISDSPHERPLFCDSSGVRVLMIEHLKPNGITETNKKYITKEYSEKLSSTKLKENDLVMARIGVTTGVVSIVDNALVGANISGNITLIRLNSDAFHNEFILHYLNSVIGKLYIKRILSNSARDFLTVRKIKAIKIPIIHKSKQLEILNHINKTYKKAKQLQEDATNILEDAKAKVEQIILQ